MNHVRCLCLVVIQAVGVTQAATLMAVAHDTLSSVVAAEQTTREPLIGYQIVLGAATLHDPAALSAAHGSRTATAATAFAPSTNPRQSRSTRTQETALPFTKTHDIGTFVYLDGDKALSAVADNVTQLLTVKMRAERGSKSPASSYQTMPHPRRVSRGSKEKDPLIPRVPAHLRKEAKRLKSPFYESSKHASHEIIEQGRKLYHGRGGCVGCHGKSGRGDGASGERPKLNFTNCKFQNKRSDGELFWVIKNGSPGTPMIPLVPVQITEAEAWKIIAYIRTFCKRRR